MINEAEQYNTEHPELCPCLRYKQMFYEAPRDPEVPRSNDIHFWCVYTQSVLGPDGQLVVPDACTSPSRKCYGTGKV
ncbi:MAG: hypothetical protein HY231_19470 [Acidobacteria bacterium]|nr:hypothetical protein [Acidobacteriota bacterium]